MSGSRLFSGGGWLFRQMCTAATKLAEAEVEHSGGKLPLYRRLSSLQMTGGTVCQTLNQYIMEGKAIRKQELQRCVRELRKFSHYQHALEVMEWMVFRRINYSYTDFAMHLDLVSLTKGVVEAENYFNDLPPRSKNKYTYGTLLHCYCRNLMADKALAHFEKMDELKYVNNLAFNNLMSMYMRLGTSNLGEVYRVWKSLKSVSPVTNLSYLTMLQSLRRLNDIEGLTQCFKEWESSCASYDLRLVNVVTSAYLSWGMCEEAELLFKNALKRRQGRGPFYKIHEMFILFFLENRKVDLAVCHLETALSKAKDDGWSPSPEVVSAFLKYYEQVNVDGVEKLRNILKTFNFDDNFLLRTCINADKTAHGLHQISLKEGSEISSQGRVDLLEEIN
ncbi:pentatricopeptide repeat-containing protein [Senna tora]|uniref:Pentatricopeptide repeat-containing protein n=1 Tax=Senna tora TaxID=362788 RepID=A0A834W407_9FABA|nr:pentatricopeptide repeat-containing protein [Senna tora]